MRRSLCRARLFLQYNALHSPHYAAIVKDACVHHPPTPRKPWNLIIDQDGINPSDGLSKNNSRKCCVFYWSFAEFGLRALALEEVWVTIVVVRNKLINTFVSGIAQLIVKVLESVLALCMTL